jgi:hypothetical protein
MAAAKSDSAVFTRTPTSNILTFSLVLVSQKYILADLWRRKEACWSKNNWILGLIEYVNVDEFQNTGERVSQSIIPSIQNLVPPGFYENPFKKTVQEASQSHLNVVNSFCKPLNPEIIIKHSPVCQNVAVLLSWGWY